MDFWSHLVLPLTLVFSVLYMSITLADGRPLHASRNPYMSRSFTTSSVTSSAKSSLLSSPSYASTLNSRKRTGRRNNKFLAEWATAKRPFKRRKKNKNKKKQKPQNSPITYIKLPATPYINTGNGYISRPASAGTGLMNILSTVMLSSDPNKQPNEVQRNSYSSATTANTNNNSDRLKLAQKIDNTNGIQYSSSTSYQQDQLKSSSSSNSSNKKKKNGAKKQKQFKNHKAQYQICVQW